MLTNAECQTRAQDCIKKAQSAREPDKTKLLHLAQCWLILADGSLPMPTDGPADNAAPTGKLSTLDLAHQNAKPPSVGPLGG